MIGKNQLVLDASEWLKGMSSGTDVSDGGFSPETEAVNLTKEPGVVYAPAQSVDSDTDNRLTGDIIASSPDMAGLGSDNRLLIARDADKDGTFYRYNGTKITATALATDTTNNYDMGFTDIITFGGEAYVTNRELIKRWENDNTITDLTGGSFNNFAGTSVNAQNFPHPILVFEDAVYYAGKNVLAIQTAIDTAPVAVLILSLNEIIIALGIDAGTGKMLISTTSTLNISNTLPATHKLIWYVGETNEILKEVIVEDMITAFHSHGGTTFVGYGQNLGFVNGSGIQFLRKLRNVLLDSEILPYKQKFASIGNTMYVVDGTQVLAFGNVLAGQKIFYYALKNKVNSNNIDCIFNAGRNKLGFGATAGSSIGEFHTVDISSVSSLDKFSFLTNFINFPRPVHIRNLQIEFLDDLSASTAMTILAINEEHEVNPLSVLDGVITTTRTFNKIGGFHKKQTALKISLDMTTSNIGLKRIVIYYDFAE